MPLLEYLRKTNKDGRILRHIREKYNRLVDADDHEVYDKTLEDFANDAPMRGEVLVADAAGLVQGVAAGPGSPVAKKAASGGSPVAGKRLLLQLTQLLIHLKKELKQNQIFFETFFNVFTFDDCR